jgi:hypothetical protein
MRVALVTTTIHVPEVLRLYRAHGPDVKFFIALDKNSDFQGCSTFGTDAMCSWLTPHFQKQYMCSENLGWNTIGRRSVAVLEALKWGADAIVSIDDDNIPMDCLYFNEFKEVLREPFNGLQAGEPAGWLDYGQWLGEPARQRGIPPGCGSFYNISYAVDARIGVAQGLCLGDPDTDAIVRLSRVPVVQQVSELLRAGIVVHPLARTVFNTQNVAFVRELAPCFLLCPQFGRHDDIYASLICRRVMRETGHHLHLGKPFCWQQRNDHDLLADLKNEMWGMQHVVEFADWLDKITWQPNLTVVERIRYIYQCFANLSWMPAGVSELGLAWCDDVESVL